MRLLRERKTETVRLLTCDTSQEARLIQGRLKNEGITSIVTNENFTTMMPMFNGMLGAGVQVIIYKTDYLRASKILNLHIKYHDSKTEEIICPACQSNNIEYSLGQKRTPKWFAIILSAIVMIPFNNIKNSYYCRNCKTEFK